MLPRRYDGMMTFEQAGYIMALAKDLGEYDIAIEWLRNEQEEAEAKDLIRRLEKKLLNQMEA